MTMSIILDLIILIIIGVCVLVSARRGFVRTLIETVGFILAIIMANAFSGALSDITYDKFIEPGIIRSVESIDVTNASSSLDAKLTNLPSTVKTIISNSGALDSFKNDILANINSGIKEAATHASQNVVKPIIAGILSIVFTLLIFIILLLVVKLLAKLLNKLFSFSVAGKINRFLGAGIGVVKGAVFALIFAIALTFLISLSKDGFLGITQATVDKTYILKKLLDLIKL